MKKLILAAFVASFLFMADYASAGFATMPPAFGCCQFENDLEEPGCARATSPNFCRTPPGFALVGFLQGDICQPDGLCRAPSRNVPTMSEWGLIAMAGVMGIIGYMILRRRKATA